MTTKPSENADKTDKPSQKSQPEKPKEIGGVSGPEPTRYGDWENGGRCTDF